MQESVRLATTARNEPVQKPCEDGNVGEGPCDGDHGITGLGTTVAASLHRYAYGDCTDANIPYRPQRRRAIQLAKSTSPASTEDALLAARGQAVRYVFLEKHKRSTASNSRLPSIVAAHPAQREPRGGKQGVGESLSLAPQATTPM